MSTIGSFLEMGGYAAFVWPAYGIAALVLGGLTAASVRALRVREREAQEMEADRPRRRRAQPEEPANEA